MQLNVPVILQFKVRRLSGFLSQVAAQCRARRFSGVAKRQRSNCYCPE